MLQPSPALAAGVLTRPKAFPAVNVISSAPAGYSIFKPCYNSLSLNTKVFISGGTEEQPRTQVRASARGEQGRLRARTGGRGRSRQPCDHL